MTHLPGRSDAAVTLLAFVLAFLAVAPAAAQHAAPMTGAWHALPGVIADGARVQVKTRDGHSTRGRLRSLSDTAIVVEAGQVKVIESVEVVSIEDWRGRRPIIPAMKAGAGAGAVLFGFYLWAAAPYLIHGVECAPADDECISGSDVLYAAILLPATGAAIGAGLGALVPGTRTLVYKAGADVAVGIAPLVGRGRRGIALRVAF